jgi:ABC-type thiamine transport system substrate-binding protein
LEFQWLSIKNNYKEIYILQSRNISILEIVTYGYIGLLYSDIKVDNQKQKMDELTKDTDIHKRVKTT